MTRPPAPLFRRKATLPSGPAIHAEIPQSGRPLDAARRRGAGRDRAPLAGVDRRARRLVPVQRAARDRVHGAADGRAARRRIRRATPLPVGALRADLAAAEARDDRRRGREVRRSTPASTGKASRRRSRRTSRRGRVVAGGSTITQQLAKNLFLSPAKSYWRKAEEAVVTVMLEAMLPKQRILELYLNVIEWGNGVFGAEAAAQRYFGISGRAAFRRAGGAARRDGARAAPVRAQSRVGLSRRSRRDDPRADAGGAGAVSADSRRRLRREQAAVPMNGCAVRGHRLESPRRVSAVADRSCAAGSMPETLEEKSAERTEPRASVQKALAEVTTLLRRHRLVEGLIQDQEAERGARRGRGARRERRLQAEQGGAAAEARPPASGRHRLHPRSAAARRAALHLGPRQGATATATSCSRSPTPSANR